MIPFLKVQSVKAQIGIETTKASMDIRRPQPDIQVHSARPVVSARNLPGELLIDQSETDNALTGGRPEAFWQRIYSQYKEVAMQNLQYIVEKGNRIGDLRIPGRPVAEMALNEFREGAPDLQIFGEASSRNIKFSYIPNEPDIQVQQGQLDIQVQTHRPQINVQRGSIRFYMERYPHLEITPPEIDILV